LSLSVTAKRCVLSRPLTPPAAASSSLALRSREKMQIFANLPHVSAATSAIVITAQSQRSPARIFSPERCAAFVSGADKRKLSGRAMHATKG
jgi:hypothetical protein